MSGNSLEKVISKESSTEKSFEYTTNKISPSDRNDTDESSATPSSGWQAQSDNGY